MKYVTEMEGSSEANDARRRRLGPIGQFFFFVFFDTN